MTKEIELIPDIQKEIIEAINQNKLVIFLGAGVSRVIGCKGWDDLATSLVDLCFNKKLIIFKEKEGILRLKDNKKIISICHYILKKEHEELFYKKFFEALKADNDLIKEQNIYKELSEIPAIFVTTNADEYLSENFREKQVVFRDFKADEIDISKVYHIHGKVTDRESLIFTVDKYIQRYRDDQQFKDFIKRIFSGYTVLFIGYGISEFELFDYLVENTKEQKEIKHFALMPFFRDEKKLVEYEQSYFDHLKIKIIPYAKDIKGYNQLYDIIKKWKEDINQISIAISEIYDEIDEAIENDE